MTLKISDLNLEPAILARRIMRFEAHTFSEVGEQVYLPTDETLRSFALKNPKLLLCSASKPAHSISQGKRVNIHLILPDKKVLHIGSVLDQQLSFDLWDLRKNVWTRNDKKLEGLRPPAIRRESWLSLIPSSSRNLSLPVLEESTGRYLWQYAPELMSNLPRIEWLNSKNESLAFKIEETISKQAEMTATSKIDTLTTEEVIRRMSDEDSYPF